MAWDKRDLDHTVYLIKDPGTGKYKIHGMVKVYRKFDDTVYMEPIPQSDFYTGGLGSLGYFDLEIISPQALRFNADDSLLRLHAISADKNLSEQ